jgi:RNase P protein component
MNKTCKKCGIEKPIGEFYRNKSMADGLFSDCKSCSINAVLKNRASKIDYYREKDRLRGNGMTPEKRAKWRANNLMKVKAQRKVQDAVKRGLMKRRCCEVCGNEKTHGHHDDYTRPLDVRWLCAAHHAQWHAKHGEAKTA